jgi:hypothetical protein
LSYGCVVFTLSLFRDPVMYDKCDSLSPFSIPPPPPGAAGGIGGGGGGGGGGGAAQWRMERENHICRTLQGP